MKTKLKEGDTLIKKKDKGLTVFEFPNLNACAGVRHGIFSRHGGNSRGVYESLNVSLGIGDDNGAVLKNRQQISRYFQNNALVFAEQVHGKEVRVIHGSDMPVDNNISASIGQGDAMITNIPGVNLVIQIADCQAVMIYDPESRVVANVHAGWRGNVQNIIGCTVKVMTDRFKSCPADLNVGVGPSLGPCCAEFVNFQSEFPENYWGYKDDLHHFDLWALSCHQLCEAGVRYDNIFVSGMCTKCNSDMFYSYRAQKETGRFAAVIGLI